MGVAIPQVLTEDRASGAQIVDGSLRFDQSKSNYLSFTPTTTGNRRTWTFSCWFRKMEDSANRVIFTTYGSSPWTAIQTEGTGSSYPGQMQVTFDAGVSPGYYTAAKYRDTGWYHLVWAVDTTQSTDPDKSKVYINGVLQTYSVNGHPGLNEETPFNLASRTMYIGYTPNQMFDGQMSQCQFIDGQALGPEYFGYTDPLTNTWRPKKFKPQATPNNGTVWSSGAGSNFESGNPASNGFNGNPESYTRTDNATVTATVTFPTSIPFTTLQIRGARDSGNGTISVNGVDVSSQFPSATATLSTVTITGVTSPLTSISLGGIGGSAQPRFSQIIVDGVTLIDGDTSNMGLNGFYLPMDGNSPIGQDQSGNGNDFTPVNFGGSNTLEKATGALPILNTDGGGKVARVGVRTDSNASSLVLALPLVGSANDVSNQINSGSTTKSPVNQDGSATASSTQSVFYGGSYYFDGNDTLRYDNLPHIGTGDFTVECWYYKISHNSYERVVSTSISTQTDINTGFILGRDVSGVTGFSCGNSYITGPAIALGRWYHLAGVRKNGVAEFFVNGVSQGTTANTTNLTNTDQVYVSASYNSGSEFLTGYVSDVRVYNGLAKYTQNFIPASTSPDILPDTPSGVSGGSKLTKITDGAVSFDGSGDYLQIGSSADFAFGTGDYTAEFFIYPLAITNQRAIIDIGNATWQIYNNSSGQIVFYNGADRITSSSIANNIWYHIAITRSSNTTKLFINGQQDGSSYTDTTNYSGPYVFTVADRQDLSLSELNAFISNLHIVKGTALYTSNFTPPTAPLTSVANTKLLCCQSTTSATTAAVTPGSITANGNASATNFNPFTTDINTVRGQETGYCTLNPLWKNSNSANNGGTYANGNLQHTTVGSNGNTPACASVYVSSGKWYWEAELISGLYLNIGVASDVFSSDSYPGYGTGAVNGQVSWGYISHTGNKIHNSTSPSSYGATFSIGDIVGVAMNLTTGELTYYKNGVSQGVAFSNLSGNLTAAHGDAGSAAGIRYNFGQKPFKFPPPDGFQPLNAANVRPSTVIARPDQYVGVTTYTSTGSSLDLNIGFKPDFVWFSRRNATGYIKFVQDSVRGIDKVLATSHIQGAEAENALTGGGDYTQAITSLNFNGVTIGTNIQVNEGSGGTYVAWAWKAGGNKNTFNVDDVGYATASAAGLDGGTITPTGASVGTKQGFSIIGYTGTDNTSDTFSHGLSQKPDFAIFKNRSQSGDDWIVYHSSQGATKRGKLNLTNAFDAQTSQFNDTEPTSSVFTIGTYDNINKLNNNYISYIWHDVPGLQKFGSYTGNGNADGPFIELGFRPAVVLFKSTGSGSWVFNDSEREPFNPNAAGLLPNSNAIESDVVTCDFLSNGFKLRGTNGNTSSQEYIYAAFAEAPSFNLYGAQSNAR